MYDGSRYTMMLRESEALRGISEAISEATKAKHEIMMGFVRMQIAGLILQIAVLVFVLLRLLLLR